MPRVTFEAMENEWHPSGFARLVRNLDLREESDENHAAAHLEVMREEEELATPEAVRLEQERKHEQEMEQWRQRSEMLMRQAGLTL